MSRPPVAIAHDYLTQRGGAERVVLSMLAAFPDATVFTTLYDPAGTYPEFRNARVVTSGLNRFGPLRRHHRAALPILAPAAARVRVDADVTLVSSSGWAHGFDITGRRLVYCHNPARWLYQADEYLGGSGLRARAGRVALSIGAPPLRLWDRRAAARADRYLANSTTVRDRIRNAYGIEADVLHPPHGVDPQAEQEPVPELTPWRRLGYSLVVSRLLPYKNVDKVVEAFTGLADRLVVVGHGPEEQRLRSRLGPNMRLVSALTDSQLRWVYHHAEQLVAPSLEDFGLTPLEAAAFGRPTLALRAGGYLDTIVEGRTGLYFDSSTPAAIRAALAESRRTGWSASVLQEHAARFALTPFEERLRAEVAALTGPDRSQNLD